MTVERIPVFVAGFMKGKFYRFIFIILLFGIVPAAAAASVPAQAADSWLRIESRNFQLVGNADEASLQRVAMRLEQFRGVFTELFPQMKFTSPIPTRVVVFRDKPTFDRFKPVEWAAGYFQPGEEVNYIVLSAEGGESGNFQTIFHEYTHFLIDNSIGRAKAPPWLNEGLAEYYEKFSIENDRLVTLGAPHEGNLQLLRRSQLIPFDVFLATDYYTLHKQSKESAQLFYAQSWALLHYLLQDDARRARFDRFIDSLIRGRTAKEAFEQAFETDFAAVEGELRKYVAQKNLTATVVPLREKLVVDADLRTFAVSAAEAKAFQGDLLFRTKRLDEAEKLLTEALALDADLGLANTALGLVKMRQNKFAEAKIYLEKAIRGDTPNYLAFFSYALAISRESMTEFGFASNFSFEDAEKIRASLRRAIGLNPDFAESYNLLTFVNVIRNEEIEESIVMINKALSIAPGNQWYAIRLAELYMRQENFAQARALAQRVLQTAADDRLKVYAENSVRTINSLEAQILSVRNRIRRPDPEEVTDEPMSDEEIARRRAKAMLESLNETLRKPQPGEKRLLGVVTQIDCRSGLIVVSVKADARVLQFKSDSFETLRLVSFEPSRVSTDFGCGAVSRETLSVVTYRPQGDERSKITGELISIEFVPADFRLLGEKRE